MSSNANSPFGAGSPKSGTSSSKPLANAELELRDIVLVLRRRKQIILAAFAIGVVIASIIVFFSPKEYSSTATIEINRETDNALGLSDLSGMASDLGGGEDSMTMELMTEEAVITNENTALGVIEQLKLNSIPPYAIPPVKDGKITPLDEERSLPLEQAPLQRQRILGIFHQRLRVQLEKGTRLVDITFTDTDPKRSTAIANAVVNVFTDEYTQARYDASSKVSDWLTNKMADLKDKVESSQAKVDRYERDNALTGMTGPSAGIRQGASEIAPSSNNVPLERLLELNRDLTNAEVSRIAKEAIYRMTETQDPDVVLGIGSSPLVAGLGSDSVLSPGSADLTLLQQLRQQLAQLKVQLAASGTKYGAKNPIILQLDNEENALEGQIRKELVRIRSRAKNDLDLATLSEAGIQQRVTAQEQDVNKQSEKADQLVLLQEEALSNRAIYQDLYSKLQEASVTAGIKASNITLVNPARVPALPSSPRKKKTAALGGLLGLVFGLFAAFSRDYFDDSIAAPEQVEQITSIPVMGAIPDFAEKQSTLRKYGIAQSGQEPAHIASKAWILRAPRSQISEVFRTFRTALLMSRAEKPPKVVLSMSGLPGEGKSTLCFNTAAAFAVQGDRVLYLDADFRRPTGHAFFNCSNDAGLCNCLTSETSFKSVIKPAPEIDTLFLLPSGPHPPNPSELIGSKRFANLIEELRKTFDYVFIDSPPVLMVTDAQLIASLTDGYFMVVRSGKTTKRALQRALALMRTPKASALGIVLNAISAKSASYSGYGYYADGSDYYVDKKK